MSGTKHLHSLATGKPAAAAEPRASRRQWATPRVIVGSHDSRVAGAGKSGTTIDQSATNLTIMTFGPAS
jgi:hypothetical protein